RGGHAAVTRSIGGRPGSAGLGRGGAEPPGAQVAVPETDRAEVVDAADPAAAGDRVDDLGTFPVVRHARLDDVAQRIEVAARPEVRQQLARDEADERLALDARPASGGEIHVLEAEVEDAAIPIPDRGGDGDGLVDRVEGCE